MIQTTFEQRVDFLITFLEIFRYKSDVLENNPNEEVFYDIVQQHLVAGLPKGALKVLTHLHWYKPEAHHFGKRISLIGRLIETVCTESVEKEEVKATLHIYSPFFITGISSEEKLKEILKFIDIIWRRNHIATISYEEGYIYFEILRRV